MTLDYARKGVSLRLPEDLKSWLDARADDNGRSTNREIIQMIKAERARTQQKEHA
jgi:plasmid stability protein